MSLKSFRYKIKRTKTLDRRTGYVAPTSRDVLCPYFDQTFRLVGTAHTADDFYAVCNDIDDTQDCDYKDIVLLGSECNCKRYWKKSLESIEAIDTHEKRFMIKDRQIGWHEDDPYGNK